MGVAEPRSKCMPPCQAPQYWAAAFADVAAPRGVFTAEAFQAWCSSCPAAKKPLFVVQ
jgi:hypothetical protein